ncbi:Sir2 family NAD-dependent protein deacetylase [Natrinema sp. J7-1]|uniref:SIR2 family NAD-dependent protein deacylase n=1 Tax=Natrinema sp. J7-1 TaxID=1172566 RepID=UPI000677A1AA|nr:Sir2 family NAD-dependent protein deacetylase [Natrinema sp. J7-1]
MDDLERLADAIRRADTVVAVTGAGLSAPSGVPTFRGDDGIWERFDERQVAADRFRRDPAGFWADRVALERAMFDEEYEPNVGHQALAAMGRDGNLEAILTQNTDGLHGDAVGAGGERPSDGDPDAETGTTVLELHGNSRRGRCTDCGTRRDSDPIVERAAAGELPPTCECGGVFKPDVVLFGDRLPDAVFQRARALARESDAFLAIGSSLVVEPAASLPRLAASTGATVAIVNLEPTPCDGIAETVLREDVTAGLPRLRDLTTA